MTQISSGNHSQFAQYLDADKNGQLNELTFTAEAKQRADTDHDQQVSTSELAQALKQDKVVLQQDRVMLAPPRQALFIEGKENIENVHATVSKALKSPAIWAPAAGSAAGAVVSLLTSEDQSYAERESARKARVAASNVAYLAAVVSMQSTLNTLKGMTAQGHDQLTKSIHSQAAQGINSSTSWGAGMAVGGYLAGIGGVDAINIGLKTAHTSLHSNLHRIKQLAEQIPEPSAALSQLNQSIASGYAELSLLEKDIQKHNDAMTRLESQAKAMDAKVTGRTKPYAIIGAGVGAAAGAAAGYFLGDKSAKSALIGAGIGTAVTAAIGGFTGHSIDRSYERKAGSLREQVQTLQSFDPARQGSVLNQANQQLHKHAQDTQGYMGLDAASALESNIKQTQRATQGVLNELQSVNRALSQSEQ